MDNKFEFQNSITLGNILSTLSMIFSLVGCLLYFNSRLVVVETKMPYLEQNILNNSAATRNLSEAQAALARSMEHITTLLEERMKSK
jgi:hypothetical protein